MIRRPTTILGLLTALNLLNYLDRIVVSAVLKQIKVDLDLSYFMAGLLGSVFILGYSLTSPIFGSLADRGSRKVLIALGVAVWSIATIASGLAGTALSLLAIRACVGVGEASYATVAPTIIDDASPPAKKGRWLAVFYVATPVGSALGWLVGGFVAKHWGWRHAFFVAGGPGLLLAFLCLLIQEPIRKKVTAKADLVANIKRLWPLRTYRRGVLGYCAYTFAIGGFSHWAPTFLQDRYKLDIDVANFRFGLITVVAGAIGTAIGGSWADRALARARTSDDDAIARVNLRVCSIGAFLGAPACVACFLAPSPTQFFVVAFVAEIALFLGTSPINAAILRSVPTELRASAMALSIFAIHVLGDLWSPSVIGLVATYAPMASAMMAVPFAIAAAAVLWHQRGVAREA